MAEKASPRAERARSMVVAARAVRPQAEAKLDAIRQTIEHVAEALPRARASAPGSEGAHAAVEILLAAAREIEDFIHRPRESEPS